jgi:hypothetical protein
VIEEESEDCYIGAPVSFLEGVLRATCVGFYLTKTFSIILKLHFKPGELNRDNSLHPWRYVWGHLTNVFYVTDPAV